MSSKYYDYGFSNDVIYGHIKNLKKKIEKSGAPDYIKNVYGVGYKFISLRSKVIDNQSFKGF